MTQVPKNTENPAQFTGFMSENERVLTFGETGQADLPFAVDRLRTLFHPVHVWKRKVGLRELYPASWRWVMMSDNIQEYRSPRLLCVPLKTSHHRQCPLLFVRRCHLAKQLTLYCLRKVTT
jgi:hypothetical protein